MTLRDISEMQRKVLQALRVLGAGTRVTIAEKTELTPQQVSGCLSRLEGYGLIDAPDAAGQGWAINADGLALFAGLEAPTAESEPDPVAAAEDETNPAADDMDDADGPDALEMESDVVTAILHQKVDRVLAADILNAAQVEHDLFVVRSRLRAPVVPARAGRIYREIVEALPVSLVAALQPITRLIEAHESHN